MLTTLRIPTARRRLLLVLGAGLLSAGLLPARAEPQPLRLAVERDYAPFVFTDAEGQPQGLSIDMLSLALAESGLTALAQPPQPLATLLEDLRSQRADLITSLRSTPERAEFLVFSRPYIEVPAILVLGAAVSASDARKGLKALAGRPVAVGKGYGVEAPMRQRYPEIHWQAVEDDAAALRGVSEGRYTGAVADAASVAFLIRRDGFMDLQPAGRVGFDYPLSFALAKPHAALMPRIDQGIQSIAPAARQAVIDRWMGDLDLDAFDRQPRWLLWSGMTLMVVGATVTALRWRQRGSPDRPPTEDDITRP